MKPSASLEQELIDNYNSARAGQSPQWGILGGFSVVLLLMKGTQFGLYTSSAPVQHPEISGIKANGHLCSHFRGRGTDLSYGFVVSVYHGAQDPECLEAPGAISWRPCYTSSLSMRLVASATLGHHY